MSLLPSAGLTSRLSRLPCLPGLALRRAGKRPGDVRDRWRLPGGACVTLRPANAGDGEKMQAMLSALSMESRYQRFFYPLRELPPEMLARLTRPDPAGAMTLLATMHEQGREMVAGVAEYVVSETADSPRRADFAVMVADAWQRHGIAARMLRALVDVARGAGIGRLEGDVLAENEAMRRLMLSLGFELGRHPDGAYLRKAWKMLDLPARRPVPAGGWHRPTACP